MLLRHESGWPRRSQGAIAPAWNSEATELNDHETIRLMVIEGVGASILPHSSVYRECLRGLLEAHRISETGVFRTLALGVAINRTASAARNAVAEIVTRVLADIAAEGKLRPSLPTSRPRRRAVA
jgi:DNA-binding transcriptional LysR family regulator